MSINLLVYLQSIQSRSRSLRAMPPGGGARPLADGLPGGVRIVSGIVSLKKKIHFADGTKGLLVVRGFVTKKKDSGRTRKA